MKHLPICLAILLCGLTSCNHDSVSPVDELTTRMSGQTDSTYTSGITFGLGDTVMTEEIEEIDINASEWEDEPMNVEL